MPIIKICSSDAKSGCGSILGGSVGLLRQFHSGSDSQAYLVVLLPCYITVSLDTKVEVVKIT
jgi:hypothetical protein